MDGNEWISFSAAVMRVAPATGGEDQAKAALFERLGYRLAPWVDYPADDAGRPVKFARPNLQFHCPLRRRVASAPPKHRLLRTWEDGSPDWFGFLRQFSQDCGDDATWQTFLWEMDGWLASDCGLMLDVGEVDRLMVDGDEWIPLWLAENFVLPVKPRSDTASGFATPGRPAGDWILRAVYAGDIACAGHGAPVPPLEDPPEFPSPAYFSALNWESNDWAPEQRSVANDFYVDFYSKFAFGGGLFVSRRDVERTVSLEQHPDNRRIDATMRMSAWRFPEALAWVATKDRAEVARATHIVDTLIRLPAGHQSDVMTEWLGRLILITAWSHCGCNSRPAEGQESWETCGCIDAAVRALVANGGEPAAKGIRFWQNNRVPGRFELDWPEGAERILFPAADVMARWPAVEPTPDESATQLLIQLLEDDATQNRSKPFYREKVMTAHMSITARHFDNVIWPKPAKRFGKQVAGAKRKLDSVKP